MPLKIRAHKFLPMAIPCDTVGGMEPNTKPLLSPCHNKQVYVSVDGNDSLTIWCSEIECYDTWDQFGNPE